MEGSPAGRCDASRQASPSTHRRSFHGRGSGLSPCRSGPGGGMRPGRIGGGDVGSASSSSMRVLAPSSSCTFLKCLRRSRQTFEPPRAEPVKEIIAILGSVHIASPRIRATGYHLQHALGQARLFEDAGDDDATRNRRARIRLWTTALPNASACSDRTERKHEREIERVRSRRRHHAARVWHSWSGHPSLGSSSPSAPWRAMQHGE